MFTRLTRNQFFSGFLDRGAVTDAIDKASIRNLMRMGGNLRTIARRSMRVRKGPSEPGNPPNAHTRLLRDNIFFAYQFDTSSVVVGPALLKEKMIHVPKGQTVPEFLEFGGTLMVREFNDRGRWIRSRYLNPPAGAKTRKRSVEVKPRPYMGPALELSQSRYADIWRDSVVPTKVGA